MRTQDSNIIKSFISEWKVLPDNQKWLYFFYSIVLIGDITNVFIAIENRIGLSFFIPISDIFFTIIALLGCIGLFFRSVRVVDFIFFIALLAYYLVSQYTHPATESLHAEAFERFASAAIPMYFVGLTFNTKTSTKIFVFLSLICIILRFLFLTFQGVGVTETGEERTEFMSAAYMVLPFVCFLFYNAIENNELMNYLIAIFALFVIMSLGVRGPVVCLIVFVAVYLLTFKTYKRNFITKLIIALLAFSLYSFYTYIILGFAFVASSLGFSTRVFESIQMDQFVRYDESSGRDRLLDAVISYIKQNNLQWGDGLFSDRLIIGTGEYAHNMELELMCDFGYIGGSIFFVILFLFFFHAFRSVWGSSYALFLLVFFCSSIIQLQFSGSFFLTPMFWLFIGMCVNAIRNGSRVKKFQLFTKVR